MQMAAYPSQCPSGMTNHHSAQHSSTTTCRHRTHIEYCRQATSTREALHQYIMQFLEHNMRLQLCLTMPWKTYVVHDIPCFCAIDRNNGLVIARFFITIFIWYQNAMPRVYTCLSSVRRCRQARNIHAQCKNSESSGCAPDTSQSK